MSRTVGLLLLLSGIAGRPLAAQTQAEQLARRADSLAALWQEARALADLTDSLAHVVAPPVLDTVSAGALRVIVNPSPLPVQEAAEGAWRILDSAFGTAAARMRDRPVRLVAIEPDSVARTSPAYRGQQVSWDTPAEELRSVVLIGADLPQPGPPLREWVSAPVATFFRDAAGREATYLQLVAGPYTIAHECYHGDLHACAIALGLDSALTPATDWYRTPAERRAVVLGSEFLYQNGRTQPDLDRCRAGDDAACIALLGQTPLPNLTRPLDTEARQSVLRVAVGLGGRAAYERALTHPDLAPAAALALAAGAPIDRVIAAWRDSVFAARPRPVSVNPVESVAGLLWIVGFAGLALRSTRWRIG